MSKPTIDLTNLPSVFDQTVNQLAPNVPNANLGPTDTTAAPGTQFQSLFDENLTQDSTDPWLGKPLGNYVLERLIGIGGMGRVYCAKHRWLENPVAVKVLHPTFNGNPEAISRFQREAKLAAGLNHPNIVKATDGGPVGNSFYLVTELIEGCDLAELVRTRGPLPVDAATWLICEVAQGLEYAHQHGLIHRDIKPGNIMLPTEGPIKILDLGLARLAESETNLTSTGQFMGTLDYVAPEQATDTRGVNHQADIYSLGCTLYFLVTGRAPFEGCEYETAASKILAHAEEEPVPVRKLRRDVPKPLGNVLECAMAKFPEDRFLTAADFAEALQPFSDEASLLPLRQPSMHGKTAAPTRVAPTFFQSVETFSDRVLNGMWIVLRTFLLVFAILTREEETNKSRWSKRRFRYAINPRGVFMYLVIGGFIALIMFGGMVEFVEVEPPKPAYYYP